MSTHDLNEPSPATASAAPRHARRNGARVRAALISMTIASGVCAQGAPGRYPPDVQREGFEAASLVDTAELAQMRGGFSVAGVEVDLGARIRTLINGQQVLESVLELSDRGLRLVESTPAPGLQQGITVDQVQQIVSVGTGTVSVSSRVSESGIVSFLTIDAFGQSIRHELTLDVTISNFSSLQRTLRAAALAEQATRSARP